MNECLPMIDLTLIGIGTGNPNHLTLQGVEALQGADLVLIPSKGVDKSDLAGLRHTMLQRHLRDKSVRIVTFDLPRRDTAHPDYRRGVDDWHDAIAQAWQAQIMHCLPDSCGTVAFLVWGDPSLYDSSLRIARRLSRQIPLRVQVIPGITAIQALCAAHAIPLNRIGTTVQITTGRRVRDHGWPHDQDSIVVMLDGDCAFQSLPPEGLAIWWGAYLGLPNQCLDHGPLAVAGPRIMATRAVERERHGWIMDIYLLRRATAKHACA